MRFEFQASLRADFLHGGAALSDENSLLAFALHVNRGANARDLFRPSKLSISTAMACGTSSRVARIAFSRTISAARKRSG
jgi:hypothetical protein